MGTRKWTSRSLDKILLAFQITGLTAFAALLLLSAYASLDWRMEHDTPLLHYAAFLMDRYDLVPYRDLFETSMPVTFAFHYSIGKLFGYGDLVFRYVDLALLSALLAATIVFMRRFGRLAATWSAILFGLIYLSLGQEISLQRDYIGVIPIAFALACMPRHIRQPVRLRRFAVIGLLFGVSVLIKPHLGLTLPIVFGTLLAFRWHSHRASGSDFAKCAAVSGVSLLIPASIALVWLAATSALVPFINILVNYIPLHSALTGRQESISTLAFARYLILETSTLHGFGALFLSSLFAYYHVVTNTDRDDPTVISLTCVALCTLAYAIYPTLAGKFWTYHYMPFVYFCCISSALCFFARSQSLGSPFVSRTTETLLLLAVGVVVAVQLPLRDYLYALSLDLRSGSEAHAPNDGRVDEIAAWLKARLQPGDSVQPLDWTGGSIHAMLLAEARLSTQFLYDYHFYHHVSSPCIQGLRRSFMTQLRTAFPRFVIEVIDKDKPWVSGIDTTYEFPELRQFLNDYYTVVHEGDGYLIEERVIDPWQNSQRGAAPAVNSAALLCRG